MSGENDSTELRVLIQEISTRLEALQTLGTQVQETALSMAKVEVQINDLHDDMTKLSNIIRDGNGQKPLLTRVTELEGTVATFNMKSSPSNGNFISSIAKDWRNVMIIALIIAVMVMSGVTIKTKLFSAEGPKPVKETTESIFLEQPAVPRPTADIVVSNLHHQTR